MPGNPEVGLQLRSLLEGWSGATVGGSIGIDRE